MAGRRGLCQSTSGSEPSIPSDLCEPDSGGEQRAPLSAAERKPARVQDAGFVGYLTITTVGVFVGLTSSMLIMSTMLIWPEASSVMLLIAVSVPLLGGIPGPGGVAPPLGPLTCSSVLAAHLERFEGCRDPCTSGSAAVEAGRLTAGIGRAVGPRDHLWVAVKWHSVSFLVNVGLHGPTGEPPSQRTLFQRL